jgi:enoyl-CoA hydratase/carnithine racemase
MAFPEIPSADPPVTLEYPQEHVALVTLRRPAARNAINAEATHSLERMVIETEADTNVWAVVLTGTGGRVFSSGADLKEVADGGLPGLMTAAGGFAGFVHAKRQKLWIAAVDGLALAGGFEIALACDLIVASEDAEFGLPEVTRGLVASGGGVYRLPRALPRALAFELIAGGGRLSAQRALALGLLNRVVEKHLTVPTALDMAAAICANAPLAVRESLAVARRAFDLDDATLRRLSDEAQERIMQTADFGEGSRAFVEKRKPKWLAR